MQHMDAIQTNLVSPSRTFSQPCTSCVRPTLEFLKAPKATWHQGRGRGLFARTLNSQGDGVWMSEASAALHHGSHKHKPSFKLRKYGPSILQALRSSLSSTAARRSAWVRGTVQLKHCLGLVNLRNISGPCLFSA